MSDGSVAFAVSTGEPTAEAVATQPPARRLPTEEAPWVRRLLIGLAVYFIVPGLGKKDGDSFFRPQPNPDARPAPIDSADVEAVVPDAPASDAPATAATPGEAGTKETQYDFYTLLPGKEVQMSDAELAASAREEEARKARAALSGQSTTVAPTPAGNDSAQPAPIDETPTPRATASRAPPCAPGRTRSISNPPSCPWAS